MSNVMTLSTYFYFRITVFFNLANLLIGLHDFFSIFNANIHVSRYFLNPPSTIPTVSNIQSKNILFIFILQSIYLFVIRKI